jgi:hypothetical protein
MTEGKDFTHSNARPVKALITAVNSEEHIFTCILVCYKAFYSQLLQPDAINQLYSEVSDVQDGPAV